MRSSKILVLVHASLIPPEKPKNKEEWESADWNTEYDVVSTLKKLGHDVLCVGVDDDLKPIKLALEEFKPKVVFNLLEEFAGEAIFDQNVVSYLQMQGIKYTGASPRGLILSRDKALSKKILKYHRIPTPDFHVFRVGKKIRVPQKVKYPLFVKTLNEEASLGITQDCIVRNNEELTDKVKHFFDKYQTDVIAESYIDGREFYVSVWGNKRVTVLPIWELFFNKMSDKSHKIATRKVKWDIKYRKKYNIKTGPAKNLSEELAKKIKNICRRTYKALQISGYARIDLRVTESGEVYVIEANPNPDIGYKGELSDSVKAVGIEYPQLITKILKLALNRKI